MISEFWDSWPGREMQWWQRWTRTRRLRLDGEPQAKRKSRGAGRTIEAQRTLLEQLQSVHHHPLTGPVALDLHFCVTSDQPPALYKLAKFLLDVLGSVPLTEVGRGRRHVLYRDDCQVKLLYVHLWHPAISGTTTADGEVSGHTWITARPLRDVVDDVRLIGSLEADSAWDNDDDESPFLSPDTPHIEPAPTFDTGRAATADEARRWSNLNSWLVLHDRSRLQEAILQQTDAQVALLLRQYPEAIKGARPPRRRLAGNAAIRNIYDRLDDLHTQNLELLLSSPITIPLPSLPRGSSERRSFKTKIRQELEQWRVRWSIFQTLLVPLKVTFLVIPPHGQARDLDNIALEVLPLVHDVLHPSPTPWPHRFPLEAAEERTETMRNQRQLRFLSSNSVTAFEVIELQRRANDPPSGLLRLALGSGSEIGSSWTRIAEYVERHVEDFSG